MDSDRLSRAGLYARTASRMRPSQFRGVAERKAREALVPRLPVDFDRRYERQIPDALTLRTSPVAANADALRASVDSSARRRARERAAQAAAGSVTFMSRSVSFPEPTRPAWEADELDDLPRLWRLKLYAFEPLHWLVLGHADPADASEEVAVLDAWVRDWCERAEVGGPNYLRTTWTPYSVSLRLLHWARYLAWRIEDDGSAADARVDPATATLARELYKNALFLRNHVERGVDGNHLIENGAALAVAGLLVGEDGWTREGVEILAHAGRTQFLDDGGHYERSPMYHVLTTTRYLTVCDLLRRTGREVPMALRETARDAVRFLRALRPPDGRLPLLNDSVHGQGLSLGACLRYARRTEVVAGDDGEIDTSVAGAPTRSPAEGGCAASGYHWLSTDAGRLLVDGGPLGPPHLPGHAHVDLLSFLLWLDGRPVVTDTGTFDYEAGERRTYARGVRGHNTVQVGDAEPVELGGRFLLGRRVEPTVRRECARGVDLFEGWYVAPSPAAGGYAHHRSIHAGDDWWLVWDRVRSTGTRPVRSRLHLHPDAAATRESDGFRLAVGVEDDRTAGWLRPLSVRDIDVTRNEYYPRFGDARTRSTIELRAADGADVAFGALVTGGDVHPEDVDVSLRDDGTVDAVLFDGESRRVPRAALTPSRGSDDTNDLYDFLR